MKRMVEKKWMLASMAAAALAVATFAANAAGSYDGKWIVEAPAVQGGSYVGGVACNAVRFEFQVKDDQVIGSLRMRPGGATGMTVEQGPGRGATPLQGSVQADGSMTVKWASFHATGTLAGDTAQLKWKGQCGPRVATGKRIG
jgi:hypothetical protein